MSLFYVAQHDAHPDTMADHVIHHSHHFISYIFIASIVIITLSSFFLSFTLIIHSSLVRHSTTTSTTSSTIRPHSLSCSIEATQGIQTAHCRENEEKR
jgi:hypothetical protein